MYHLPSDSTKVLPQQVAKSRPCDSNPPTWHMVQGVGSSKAGRFVWVQFSSIHAKENTQHKKWRFGRWFALSGWTDNFPECRLKFNRSQLVDKTRALAFCFSNTTFWRLQWWKTTTLCDHKFLGWLRWFDLVGYHLVSETTLRWEKYWNVFASCRFCIFNVTFM